MGVKVKICGITNLEDALASVFAGCDSLGFMFYRRSPRYISPERARNIINIIPKEIVKIGVFVNTPEKNIKQIAKFCKLDILQFHGNESPEFCRRFKGYKIIKAFRVKDKINLKQIKKYKVFAYLFDTFVESTPGGTGKKFNWQLIKHLHGVEQPIFLSGGLNCRNVKKAVNYLHPDWVDVCSAVEVFPGKKDHVKVKDFVKAAKGKN
ncbi:MAG: phosphoribosylanthranilate isomerase [Candidatus Omnitrophica bacterium]|nr:phosphoribosylanthranilate isomerase [Candidatus Omnitrophota bacterium]